ncbi:MAG: substrate-binding domain-containing protein [Clostridiales bacterium]|nr:substrate-binding domain-containing protein [Clostridiales bacterium]
MKNLKTFLKILIPAAAVVLLIGIAFDILHGSGDTADEYSITRVSVILPHKDDGYWNLVAEGIEEAEAELASEYNIDINILISKVNYDIDQMTELLKQQVAAKVDYIVVQGNEDEEFREVLLQAMEEGIQVICVDTDISDFPEHLYIGTDQYEAGKLIGEELVKLSGGAAKVVVMSGEEQYQNLQERLTGFLDATKTSPDIELVEVVYDYYDGLKAMRLYQEYAGDADAMVFLEGTGAVAPIATGGNEYEYVLGFDANEGVQSGALDGIVKQDTNLMGRLVVEEIARRIETGSYSSDEIFTDIIWLTAENYDEVMG